MPDGQDKSDDLIAELAKLMASNAQGAEPEAKPAPKLVTLPDAAQPAGQGPAPVRIPGMDAPAAPAAASTPAPQPESRPPANAAPVLRIPGMDQPMATPPAPVATVSPVVSVPQPPVEAKPAASFDFGTLPAASTSFKPEPMSNWQDREIPKPVPVRPAVSEAPAPMPPAARPSADAMSELEAEAEAIDVEVGAELPEPEVAEAEMVEPEVKAPPPAPRVEPSFSSPRPAALVAAAAVVAAPPMVAAAKASPSGDSFDFDFGFGTEPPGPIAAPEPRPQARTAAPVPPPAAPRSETQSADPIADLIAAELDSAEAEADSDEPEARPTPVQPAPRSFPAPSSSNPPPRPAGSVQFRPGAAGPAQPAPRPEDRFGVAPVFGPTSKIQAPRPPQPSAERDPMDEIESLIGEAVRVELTSEKPAAPAPAPQIAPVVPPLTTGFAPRRTSIKDSEPQVPSAEAAILAAAAASGAEVGRIDGMATEQSPYKRVKAKPERRSSGGMRQYVGMAVAGTLLLAAGLGLYWVLGMGRGTDADAPVLQADATPVKEVPPPAAAAPANQQGSVVFNELDGNAAAATADEQLVSRDDSAETSVADVARTVGGEGDDAASESELANRKVRTVTVRPDGTIVSGDEAVAGNEELPVDRPAVPDLPGADVQPSELLAAVPGGAADPIGEAITGEAPATQLSALTETTGPAPTVDPSIVAPVPVARPADRSTLGGGANQQVAATQPAQPVDLVAAPAPAATQAAAPVAAAAGGSGPYVQLSSQPTEGDAAASLRTTQGRLSGLLAGRSLAVRQVNLGAKGTWYRVVLPVDSFQEATQTCASLKANGVDCVPIGG